MIWSCEALFHLYAALNGCTVHQHHQKDCDEQTLTAHCALCDTCPTSTPPTSPGAPSVTCASNTSISGAARPTNVPSLCTGPGWLSPAHVQRDSFCPGRYESTPPFPASPLIVAATGCPLMDWFLTVPMSHAS